MTANILTVRIARDWDGERSLRDFKAIDLEAAEVLAGFDDADLELCGLTTISAPIAKALAQQKNGSIALSGLTVMSDDIAEPFSIYSGFLGLPGLTSLSAAAARSLTQSAEYLSRV